CVVVAALDTSPERVFGGDECDRRTLPASTFKVPHALIALDTGVVTDKTVMTWDGKKKDFPAWERDHTLDSAIKASVVWFFQRAALPIERERELAHLRAFAYGSQAFSRDVDQFWLNGDLLISPREQVARLQRMFAYGLPIDRRLRSRHPCVERERATAGFQRDAQKCGHRFVGPGQAGLWRVRAEREPGSPRVVAVEPGRQDDCDADARGSGGGGARERGVRSRGLQHSRVRDRQPHASARRRSRRRGSWHAEGARRSEARRTPGHAHGESAGRRAAGEG